METPPKQDDITALVTELDEFFAESMACEATTECQAVSKWYAIRSCGCPVVSYCDPHRIKVFLMGAAAGGLDCRHCGAISVYVIWAPLR